MGCKIDILYKIHAVFIVLGIEWLMYSWCMRKWEYIDTHFGASIHPGNTIGSFSGS